MAGPYDPIIVGADGTPFGNRVVVGLATLVGGTVNVPFPSLTVNSFIFITPQTGTLNLGSVGLSARTSNDFTILSSNILDARPIGWMVIEP